jgi:tRNA dimethylallyltransferase
LSTIVPNFPKALIVVCGATATGKTGLAIALAQRLGLAQGCHSPIVSADSRLVYRGFDIGTAKPAVTERQNIPHFLIDVCEPTETMTLADYQEAVWQVWEKLGSQGLAQTPLLVGGTGLYIRSIVRGLKIPRVAPNAELRSQLQALGQAQCHAFLQQVDPASAQKIHPNDPVRTLRALEVFYTTGIPISAQQGEEPPPYPILQIGLDCFEPEALEARIAQRTEAMLAAGFADEVAALCKQYGEDLPLLNTLGYREMRLYLAGKVSLTEAKDLIVLHTRQFAKQQRTWFRADEAIVWFEATQPDLLEQVWTYVQKFLEDV